MKILFISHDASRTGAPILLINLIRWIKEHTSLMFDIYLIEGGELVNEFEKLGKVYKPRDIKRGLPWRIINKFLVLFRFKIKTDTFKKLRNNNYTVIYGNTIVSLIAIEKLIESFPKARLLCHVHELFSVTKYYADTIERLKSSPIKYIAVSKLVTQNLIEKHGINSEISLIYEYIDLELIDSNNYKHADYVSQRFIINGSGSISLRKGYDIFLMIAKRAIQKYNDIPFFFRWIGAIPADNLDPFFENDIHNAGLDNKVEFTGGLENPYNEYRKAKVFLLTSREDPFPLVCLEHALLGIPLICFDKVTGMTEFIENDAGFIVPYLDIEKTVDVLAELYFDSEKREILGSNAQNKVQQFDINIQIPKILNILSDTH